MPLHYIISLNYDLFYDIIFNYINLCNIVTSYYYIIFYYFIVCIYIQLSCIIILCSVFYNTIHIFSNCYSSRYNYQSWAIALVAKFSEPASGTFSWTDLGEIKTVR